MIKFTRLLSALAVVAALAGCSSTPPDSVTMSGMNAPLELGNTVAALGPEVDVEEAARLARVTYQYVAQLKREYEITDPPLVHNTKVNMGIKPRGLCKDWADDLEARLKQEGFQSLTLHRAIANSDDSFRIEHSTVIVSRKGDDMYKGIVLDPWRYGGTLYWAGTRLDDHYEWLPRQVVFANKRARDARRGGS